MLTTLGAAMITIKAFAAFCAEMTVALGRVRRGAGDDDDCGDKCCFEEFHRCYYWETMMLRKIRRGYDCVGGEKNRCRCVQYSGKVEFGRRIFDSSVRGGVAGGVGVGLFFWRKKAAWETTFFAVREAPRILSAEWERQTRDIYLVCFLHSLSCFIHKKRKSSPVELPPRMNTSWRILSLCDFVPVICNNIASHIPDYSLRYLKLKGYLTSSSKMPHPWYQMTHSSNQGIKKLTLTSWF